MKTIKLSCKAGNQLDVASAVDAINRLAEESGLRIIRDKAPYDETTGCINIEVVVEGTLPKINQFANGLRKAIESLGGVSEAA